MKIMTHRKDNSAEIGEVALLYCVEVDKGIRIDVALYCSETEFVGHSLLYKDESETLRVGISRHLLAFNDLPDLRACGFEARETGNAKDAKFYELRTFVQLNCNNDCVEVTTYAMTSNYRYPREIGGIKSDEQLVLFAHT